MDILSSVALAVLFRLILGLLSANTKNYALILGVWEGFCLNNLLQTDPSSYDPYLALFVRLALDVLLQEGFKGPVFTLMWAILTALVAAALGSEHGYDTLHERDKRYSTATRESKNDVASASARRVSSSRARVVQIQSPSTSIHHNRNVQSNVDMSRKLSRARRRDSIMIPAAIESPVSVSLPPSPPSTYLAGGTDVAILSPVARESPDASFFPTLPTPPDTTFSFSEPEPQEYVDTRESIVHRLSTVPEESSPGNSSALRELSRPRAPTPGRGMGSEESLQDRAPSWLRHLTPGSTPEAEASTPEQASTPWPRALTPDRTMESENPTAEPIWNAMPTPDATFQASKESSPDPVPVPAPPEMVTAPDTPYAPPTPPAPRSRSMSMAQPAQVVAEVRSAVRSRRASRVESLSVIMPAPASVPLPDPVPVPILVPEPLSAPPTPFSVPRPRPAPISIPEPSLFTVPSSAPIPAPQDEIQSDIDYDELLTPQNRPIPLDTIGDPLMTPPHHSIPLYRSDDELQTPPHMMPPLPPMLSFADFGGPGTPAVTESPVAPAARPSFLLRLQPTESTPRDSPAIEDPSRVPSVEPGALQRPDVHAESSTTKEPLHLLQELEDIADAKIRASEAMLEGSIPGSMPESKSGSRPTSRAASRPPTRASTSHPVLPVPAPHGQLELNETHDALALVERSPSPSTVASLVLDEDAQTIRRRAEKLRQDAWATKNKVERLRKEIKKTQNVKRKFLLECEIHQLEKEEKRLHGSAKRRFFHATNMSQASKIVPRTIDVHYLLIEEAIQETMLALEHALLADEAKLDIIVGKGLHSKGGVAKIKPEVQKMLKERGFTCAEDSKNAGLLHVTLPK